MIIAEIGTYNGSDEDPAGLGRNAGWVHDPQAWLDEVVAKIYDVAKPHAAYPTVDFTVMFRLPAGSRGGDYPTRQLADLGPERRAILARCVAKLRRHGMRSVLYNGFSTGGAAFQSFQDPHSDGRRLEDLILERAYAHEIGLHGFVVDWLGPAINSGRTIAESFARILRHGWRVETHQANTRKGPTVVAGLRSTRWDLEVWPEGRIRDDLRASSWAGVPNLRNFDWYLRPGSAPDELDESDIAWINGGAIARWSAHNSIFASEQLAFTRSSVLPLIQRGLSVCVRTDGDQTSLDLLRWALEQYIDARPVMEHNGVRRVQLRSAADAGRLGQAVPVITREQQP